MKDYIDNNSKQNEIKMLLTHPFYKDKIVAVLEGDRDIRLFRSLMDGNHIKIECAIGKSTVTGIVCDLSQDEKYRKRLFGICDADFMHITGDYVGCENVFLTDTHDIETMMLKSQAVHALISEYACNDESARLLHEDLISRALDAAYVIGIFRYICHSENLNIKFKGLHIDLYLSISGLDIEVRYEDLANALIQRSPNLDKSISVTSIIEKHKEHAKNRYDKWQLCNGHDATKIIAYILSQKDYSNEIQMNQEKVEKSLRLAYGKGCFMKTELYSKLKEWQKRNQAPVFLP